MNYLIRMPDDLSEALDAKAKRTGRTKKHIVLTAIRKDVMKHDMRTLQQPDSVRVLPGRGAYARRKADRKETT